MTSSHSSGTSRRRVLQRRGWLVAGPARLFLEVPMHSGLSSPAGLQLTFVAGASFIASRRFDTLFVTLSPARKVVDQGFKNGFGNMMAQFTALQLARQAIARRQAPLGPGEFPLEQKQNFRNVLEMVRGGFFLRKKPLDRSDSHYTYSAFAIASICRLATVGHSSQRSSMKSKSSKAVVLSRPLMRRPRMAM